MQKKRNKFIFSSLEYLVWFLDFMLIESFANARILDVIGAKKVELFYGIFILFTAAGFFMFGKTGKYIYDRKQFKFLHIILGMISLGLFGCVNIFGIVIIGAALCLFSMGYFGGKIMLDLAISYGETKYPGTIVGCSMAISIVFQYIIQTFIINNLLLVICFEIIFAVLIVFEFNQDSISLSDNRTNNKENTIFKYRNIWVYVLATIIMTIILSLNDAYLVDSSAHTNSVNLFSWVRLFYCLSLVLAGIIYDFQNSAYFNIFVTCIMMLSTVAYAFMSDIVNLNINMSIMYFYCGFYVMFLTMHFIRISNEEMQIDFANTYLISSYGRISRCVTTAVITFIMILLNNEVSVQIMILVSCVFSIFLIILLALNDILIVKRTCNRIDESLAISEQCLKIDLEKDLWIEFINKYGFTKRECDVLDKLIKTENNLQDISEDLNISKRVVQRHITSIYEKTNRATRIGLLQLYVEFIRGEIQ